MSLHPRKVTRTDAQKHELTKESPEIEGGTRPGARRESPSHSRISIKNNNSSEPRPSSNLRDYPEGPIAKRGFPSNLFIQKAAQCSLKRVSSSSGLGLHPLSKNPQKNPHSSALTSSDSGRKTNDTEGISKRQIEIYGQVFDDIIRQDNVYGGLLVSVKKNYDDYIAQLHSVIEDLGTTKSSPAVHGQLERLKNHIEDRDQRIEVLEREKQEVLQNSNNEKKQQSEVIKKLANDFRSARIRENKYLKLMSVLKEQGYPVEELYNQHIKRRQRTDDKGTSPARNAVPKIRIPAEESTGFHEEFMSKAQDFSESWRKEIEAHKNPA